MYRVVTDEPPHPDPGEVGDFEWVGWADFVYAVATGDITVSPWCRRQVTELSALGDGPGPLAGGRSGGARGVSRRAVPGP